MARRSERGRRDTLPSGRNRASDVARAERVERECERERRERSGTASGECEARGGERRRKARFLVMRTVGRQAVCRDTGIPHYFDRGCRREVVVVTVPDANAVPSRRRPSRAFLSLARSAAI